MGRLINTDALLKRTDCYLPNIRDTVRKVLRNVPTVDAEPVKRGHWIMKPNGYGTCSNCKVCSLDILGGVDSNYCPNCGAKMTLD